MKLKHDISSSHVKSLDVNTASVVARRNVYWKNMEFYFVPLLLAALLSISGKELIEALSRRSML